MKSTLGEGNVRVKVKVKVKYLYLQWITRQTTKAVLPRHPVRATLHGSSVTTEGNRSTRRKPVMLGKVILDSTLITCDQGIFNQITLPFSLQLLPFPSAGKVDWVG